MLCNFPLQMGHNKGQPLMKPACPWGAVPRGAISTQSKRSKSLPVQPLVEVRALAVLGAPSPCTGGQGRRPRLERRLLRWWEKDMARGWARAAGGEAVGSGRLDSCHTEMASGLTASRVRCLLTEALRSGNPQPVCSAGGGCAHACRHVSMRCCGQGRAGRLSPPSPTPLPPPPPASPHQASPTVKKAQTCQLRRRQANH